MIFDILLFWRSVPALLVYRTLSEKTRGLIQADILRIVNCSGTMALHGLLLRNKIFRRLFMVRVYMESPFKYRLIRWTYSPLPGLEISSTDNEIGGGLRIFHGYSTIIFCRSMGNNCTVYQNVTIGRGKTVNGSNVPTIGNNVTVYAGANIIGGINIGDNAVIGAGTTVTKDVPPNTTVVSAANRYISRE